VILARGDFFGDRLFIGSKACPVESQDQVVINIFVGNLGFGTTEEQPRALFESYGSVATVTIVEDRDTGEPRGFAFVEMRQDSEAQAAISALQGSFLNERVLRVNEARPKAQRDPLHGQGIRDHRRHHI
jgi:RNA recognition motif-containing protein